MLRRAGSGQQRHSPSEAYHARQIGNKAGGRFGSGADVNGNLPDAGRAMKAAPQAGVAQDTVHVWGAMDKEAERVALDPQREVDARANHPGEPGVARVDEAIEPARFGRRGADQATHIVITADDAIQC